MRVALLTALSLGCSIASAASVGILEMHEIVESEAGKAEVIRKLGEPKGQITFVVHKNHKFLRSQPLVCGTPSDDLLITALYFPDRDGGYWFFFSGERQVCFSGYVPYDAIAERDSSEP